MAGMIQSIRIDAMNNQGINNSLNGLPIKEGDSLSGSIKSTNSKTTQIELNIPSNNGATDRKEWIQVPTKNLKNLTAGDEVRVDILKYSAKELKISISKIETSTQSSAINHNPVQDSVNMDDVKKALIGSNNPLQYSKSLDNHIENALTQVTEMLESFSDEEIRAVLKENYDVTKMTIDLLYQVGHSGRIDKRIALDDSEERKMQITVDDEAISKLIADVMENDTLKSVPEERLKEIVTALINNEYDASPKNVEKLINFSEKVDKLKEMDTKGIVQFLSSSKETTVGEMYKSLFVSPKKTLENQVSESDYKKIEEDVMRLLDKAFLGIETSSMEDIYALGKELVMKGIPIDERSLDVITFVENKAELDKYLNLGIEQLKKLEKIENVRISNEDASPNIPTKEELEAILNVIKKTTPEVVEKTLVENKTLTVKELERQMMSLITLDANGKEVAGKEIVSNETFTKELENLEIIRYQMTFKVALRLSIEGVDIKNTQLSEIRGRLEEFEVRQMDEQASATVNNVTKHMALIQGASTHSIGTIAVEESTELSLSNLVQRIQKGIDRYDELRTQPRSDLGDNLDKAFRNIDTILTDLKLENTEYNQRAVEILARNEMPVTVENIEAVRTSDTIIQELFNRMMPEHVRELVGLNIDVLKEPIENLLAFVLKKEGDVSMDTEETIAKSIQQMLKKGDLGEEEKNTLIGMFRMIHTINKSKGAAVGFLIDKNLPVTLENLFDAAKYVRQSVNESKAFDNIVNDQFGTLVSLEKAGLTIKEQIKSGYYEKETQMNNLIQSILKGDINNISTAGSDTQGSKQGSDQESDQGSDQSYFNQITKEQTKVLRNILQEIQSMTTGVHKEAMALKENISFSEWHGFSETQKEPFAMKNLFKEFLELTMDNKNVQDQFFKGMGDYLNNLSKEGHTDYVESLNVALSEAKTWSLERYFEQTNQDKVENQLFSGEKTVHALSKEIQTHLKLQDQFIEKEDYFTVPMMINGQLQQMSMHYFRHEKSVTGGEEDMSIYLSFSTKNMGNANVRIQMAKDTVDVTMYATTGIGNTKMKEYETVIRELFSESELLISKMKYDTFDIPKPIGKDQGKVVAKQMKKYKESAFERII